MGTSRTVRVADLAAPGTHSMATGPFGSSISSRFFRTSGVPVIRGGNLSTDSTVRLNDNNLVFLDVGKAAEFSRSTVRRGDLIFTCWGTINQVGLIDESAGYDEYIVSNKQMKLTPNPSVADSEFLYYLFSAPPMQREIIDGLIGSSVPGFNLTRLRSLELKLPPLAEQKRIAQAISDAERVEIRLGALIAKKQAIKQGMMQHLLTGKIRLPSFTEPWSEGTFEQLAVPSKERAMPRNVPPATPLVELDQIESGSGRLIGKSHASDAVSLKAVFRPGDVLFGKLRAYLRKFWYADVAGLCTTEIWVFRPKAGVDGRFVRFIVETDSFIEVAIGAYGTHMPRSDWRMVRRLPVRIPPRKEQAAIASVLADIEAEIALLRVRLAKARSVKQGMMQQLLPGRTGLHVKEVAV